MKDELGNAFGVGLASELVFPVLVLEANVHAVWLSPEIADVQLQLWLSQNLLLAVTVRADDVHVSVEHEAKVAHVKRQTPIWCDLIGGCGPAAEATAAKSTVRACVAVSHHIEIEECELRDVEFEPSAVGQHLGIGSEGTVLGAVVVADGCNDVLDWAELHLLTGQLGKAPVQVTFAIYPGGTPVFLRSLFCGDEEVSAPPTAPGGVLVFEQVFGELRAASEPLSLKLLPRRYSMLLILQSAAIAGTIAPTAQAVAHTFPRNPNFIANSIVRIKKNQSITLTNSESVQPFAVAQKCSQMDFMQAMLMPIATFLQLTDAKIGTLAHK